MGLLLCPHRGLPALGTQARTLDAHKGLTPADQKDTNALSDPCLMQLRVPLSFGHVPCPVQCSLNLLSGAQRCPMLLDRCHLSESLDNPTSNHEP